MKTFLIDAGNTRIKWALAADDAPLGVWLAYGAVMHTDAAQLPDAWRAALAAHGPADNVIAANVAGAAVRASLEAMLAEAGVAQPSGIDWFASVAQRAGVRNGYRTHGQLGCDRFAAAIGAHALVPGQALIVANCGTATTIDAVTADGAFLGGMILPGLGLMASSLARNTAQLPQVAQGGKLPSGFADNTDDAILSGLLAAQAGAIERACALHGAQACLVSGGAAQYIVPALGAQVPYRLVDNIVLTGLHAAARSK
jgi:type III pantothenate kinase